MNDQVIKHIHENGKHTCKFIVNKKSMIVKGPYQCWFLNCNCGKCIMNEVDHSREPRLHRMTFKDENGITNRITENGKEKV